MKKTYISPECKLFVVRINGLLNTMSLTQDGSDNTEVELDSNDPYTGEFNAKRRDPWKNGDWDDEEELEGNGWE